MERLHDQFLGQGTTRPRCQLFDIGLRPQKECPHLLDIFVLWPLITCHRMSCNNRNSGEFYGMLVEAKIKVFLMARPPRTYGNFAHQQPRITVVDIQIEAPKI